MTTYKMADELLYPCTKCKLKLNHRIILLDGGQPKRVLCLTCKTDRMFRVSATLESNRKKPVRRSLSKIPKKDPSEGWLKKLDSGKDIEPKNYSMEAPYELNDRIQHPTFGLGLVVENIDDDKIKIFFREGTKILKCGR